MARVVTALILVLPTLPIVVQVWARYQLGVILAVVASLPCTLPAVKDEVLEQLVLGASDAAVDYILSIEELHEWRDAELGEEELYDETIVVEGSPVERSAAYHFDRGKLFGVDLSKLPWELHVVIIGELPLSFHSISRC